MARRNLTGLRVLVTGASQGIGKAVAELAAQRGMRVLASARSVNGRPRHRRGSPSSSA